MLVSIRSQTRWIYGSQFATSIEGGRVFDAWLALWNSNNAWKHAAIQKHHRKLERSSLVVNFASRPSALTHTKEANERILPFVTTYHPTFGNLKQILMEQWSLIQNHPLLKTIFLKPAMVTPPIISYKRSKFLRIIMSDQNSKAVMRGDLQNYTSSLWRSVTYFLSFTP